MLDREGQSAIKLIFLLHFIKTGCKDEYERRSYYRKQSELDGNTQAQQNNDCYSNVLPQPVTGCARSRLSTVQQCIIHTQAQQNNDCYSKCLTATGHRVCQKQALYSTAMYRPTTTKTIFLKFHSLRHICGFGSYLLGGKVAGA